MLKCVRCGQAVSEIDLDSWGPRGPLCSENCTLSEMEEIPPEVESEPRSEHIDLNETILSRTRELIPYLTLQDKHDLIFYLEGLMCDRT